MPKYTFTEIDNVNSPSAASTINANFEALQDLIDLLLSRDGTLPNTMSADLDLNGFRLLNAQNVALEGSGGDMLAATYDPSGIASQIVGLSAVQTLTNKTIDPSLNTIDGDKLDIDFTPTNYTPDASPAEASDVDDLAAHLKGIDSALTSSGDMTVAIYDPAGIAQQIVGTTASQTLTNKDINPALNGIDGDKLDIDFTPSNYTPDDSISEADDVDDLAAHLKGIDTALIAGGGLDTATYDPAGIGEQLVGLTAAQTLVNKTINPSLNGIDGDKLDIDFTPTNYTPSMPVEADDIDDLAAHLKGIDDAVVDKTLLGIDVIEANGWVVSARIGDGEVPVAKLAPVGNSIVFGSDSGGNPVEIAQSSLGGSGSDAELVTLDYTSTGDNITALTTTHIVNTEYRRFRVDQATTLANDLPASRTWIIHNVDTATVTITITAGAGGTGTFSTGGSTLDIPADGEVVFDIKSNAGDEPQIHVRGDFVQVDYAGREVVGYAREWLTSVSGALTLEDHSGRGLVTSGNVTVPTTPGFSAVIEAGGAHTVTFNSTTSAAMSTGDIMTVEVRSATLIRAVLTPSASLVSFS
jgi:hypothetical protein